MVLTATTAIDSSVTTDDVLREAPTVVFPEGLVGCADWKSFVLLTDDDNNAPVACLQSVDHADVRFVVTDPRLIEPTYAPVLSDDDRASLELDASDTLVMYCTLTVHNDGLITANLLGPLVINARTRRGRQVVLTDSGYTTRHNVAQLAEA